MPKRLRGRALALHLDKTAQYRGVVKARTAQKYLSADYKLAHNIPLNVYDAARSYRQAQGTPDRPIREVLRDQEFRNAWGTFRGGHRWEYNRDKHKWVKKYKKEGGITSTTEEKLEAAKKLGWYENRDKAIERLRISSP